MNTKQIIENYIFDQWELHKQEEDNAHYWDEKIRAHEDMIAQVVLNALCLYKGDNIK